MSITHNAKGKAGEREAASLVRESLGFDVRRRVRQHGGDSDLTGIPGWSVEVKRRRTATAGEVASWWRQAVEQAEQAMLLPALLYRADRCDWRARWPLSVLLLEQPADYWRDDEWTADTTVPTWATVVRQLGAEPGAPVSKWSPSPCNVRIES